VVLNYIWRENSQSTTMGGMPKKFLPYAQQSVNTDDIQAVKKALKGDLITRGPLVEEFECEVAKFCGAEHAVLFNSGTSALDAAGYAAKINPHDRILTSPNTFVGTITGAVKRGAVPTFVDIDLATGNLDLEQLKLTMNRPSTRGKEVLLPVHFAGIPVDMKTLARSIKDPDTVVIEDAAHALGSVYRDGQRVGCCAWSDMTVFSFHPAKHVTTGEGGCVLTNDPEFHKRLLLYRNNGIVKKEEDDPWMYDVTDITGNYHFTDIQAALGLSQLKRVDEFVETRRKLVKAYRQQLSDLPFITLVPEEYDTFASYHIFALRINFEELSLSRAELMTKMHGKGIGTQVHYIPLYHHSFLNKNLAEYFPAMEEYYATALTLPLHCNMDEKDVVRVCDALKQLCSSPTKTG